MLEPYPIDLPISEVVDRMRPFDISAYCSLYQSATKSAPGNQDEDYRLFVLKLIAELMSEVLFRFSSGSNPLEESRARGRPALSPYQCAIILHAKSVMSISAISNTLGIDRKTVREIDESRAMYLHEWWLDDQLNDDQSDRLKEENLAFIWNGDTDIQKLYNEIIPAVVFAPYYFFKRAAKTYPSIKNQRHLFDQFDLEFYRLKKG